MPEGYPQQPIVIFLDGSVFLLIRSYISMKGARRVLHVWMSPTEETKAMLKIKDEELNYEEDPYGVLEREYDDSLRVTISPNPDKPVWLMFCDFSGNPINYDKPTLFPIVELIESKKQLERENALLRTKIERLNQERQDLIEFRADWREEMKDILGYSEPEVRIPSEFSSIEMEGKKVKKSDEK